MKSRNMGRDETAPLSGEKYQFFVSDLAEKFTDFAAAILPGEVKETRQISVEEY